MHAKARTRIQYGIMCGELSDTRAKVTNVSQGFVVLSPPGARQRFQTQDLCFVESAKSTTWPRKLYRKGSIRLRPGEWDKP